MTKPERLEVHITERRHGAPAAGQPVGRREEDIEALARKAQEALDRVQAECESLERVLAKVS